MFFAGTESYMTVCHKSDDTKERGNVRQNPLLSQNPLCLNWKVSVVRLNSEMVLRAYVDAKSYLSSRPFNNIQY